MNKKTIVGVLAVFLFLLIETQTVTAQIPSLRDLKKGLEDIFKQDGSENSYSSESVNRNLSSKDLLKEGDNYYKKGNYDMAIAYYETILDLYPKAKEANDAKKKIADAEKKLQAQAGPKITTPLTEANFVYVQNKEGFITIKRYINEKEKGIRDLVIPAQIQGINVTEIAEDAFARGGLPSMISIDNSTGQIYEAYILSDKGEIFESVTIPPTVTTIGAQAFVNRGIKTLNLPDSVRFIGDYAFAKNQLSSVTLTNVMEIGAFAFMENKLSSIEWPKFIRVIPGMAFAKNQLASIVIPSSVRGIGVGAFGGNRLTEITIPENVTNIGDCAFAANMISKLTFSNSGNLKSIGIAAFSRNNLKSVVLPEGLTEIGSGTSVEFRTIFERKGDYLDLDKYFSVSAGNGILGGNPLGYIKLPTTLGEGKGNNNYRPVARNAAIPAVEWLKPNTSMFDDIGRTEALKIGDNISTAVSSRLGEGFTNFYTSQGKKAGIYMRRGQLWVNATQEEFDAFIAEKTK